jgi:hypothetical protein
LQAQVIILEIIRTHQIVSIRRASLYSIIWAFYQFKIAEAVGHPIEELIRTTKPAKALVDDDPFLYPLLIYPDTTDPFWYPLLIDPDTTYLTSNDLEEDWQASHIHPLNHHPASRNDNTLTAPGTSGAKRRGNSHIQLSSSGSIAQRFPPLGGGPSIADEFQLPVGSSVPISKLEANQDSIKPRFLGIEEFTPTESSDHDNLGDQSLNHTEPDVLLSPEVNAISHESKQRQECPQPTCFIPNGAILEPFLDEFCEFFRNKLFEKDYDAKRAPLNDPKHPSSPLCFRPSANQVLVRVTRILEESDGNSHDRRVLLTLYKLLMGWMYELYEIILNNHNIPIAHYKTYQRPWFN